MATSTTRRPVKYIQVKKNERKEDPGAGQGAPGPEDAPARISWHPLVMMSMSFILGSGLAVGHHFFYAHWDGKDVTTTISQAWITRIGTAFAFLVKVFLAVATGIAYIQQLWSSLRSQPMKVKRLNSAFSVLGDVTRLFDAGLWFRNPLLLLPALITWLIPIAAVITPGTLTVVVFNSQLSKAIQVPQPQYNYTAYSHLVTAGNPGYTGPTNELSSLVTATAIGGSILQLPSAFPNISYTMDFYGPAIQCQEANASYKAIVSKALDQGIDGGGGQSMGFVAWVPGDPYHAPVPGNVTFRNTQPGGDVEGPPWPYATWDDSSPDAMRIFVLGEWTQYWPDPAHELLECRLKNASYTAFFNFTYPSQAVELHSLVYLNDVNGIVPEPVDSQGYLNWPLFEANEQFSGHIAYMGAMDAFGRLLVGEADVSHYGFTTTYYTSWNLLPVNWSSADTAARQLEQISQNITLSLMSSPTFILNASQASPISANLSNFINVFSYNALDLWLAYGCAIFCAAVGALIGSSAAHRNGATYNNSFSTIVRTTRNPSMNALVEGPDSDGAEPMALAMAESFVILQGGRPSCGTYGGFRRTSPPG